MDGSGKYAYVADGFDGLEILDVPGILGDFEDTDDPEDIDDPEDAFVAGYPPIYLLIALGGISAVKMLTHQKNAWFFFLKVSFYYQDRVSSFYYDDTFFKWRTRIYIHNGKICCKNTRLPPRCHSWGRILDIYGLHLCSPRLFIDFSRSYLCSWKYHHCLLLFFHLTWGA